MKNRKYQKIALLMLLAAIICFVISGYWIVQAIINPQIPDRLKKEEVVQTTTNNVSLKDENLEDTHETTTKESEIHLATTKNVEPKVVANLPAKTNQTVDVLQEPENNNEESKTTAFNGVTLSQSDILLLERTTYAEAGICNEATQKAVAATILERAAERNQTIEEVIFEPGQFSCAIDGEIYLVTVKGNILTTPKMAEKVSDTVYDAIANGSGISDLLGGEPLFFYSGDGLDSIEAEKRSTISVSVTLDRVTFYRVWD